MSHIRPLATILVLAVGGLVVTQYSVGQSEYHKAEWRYQRVIDQEKHSVSYAVRHAQWVVISGPYKGQREISADVRWDQQHNASQIACLSKSNRFHAKQRLSEAATGKEYQVLIGVNPYPSSCEASFDYNMGTGELGNRVDGWCDTPQTFRKWIQATESEAQRKALARRERVKRFALMSSRIHAAPVTSGSGQVVYPHYIPPRSPSQPPRPAP